MLELFWFLLCTFIGITIGCMLVLAKENGEMLLGVVIAIPIVFGLCVTSTLIFKQ